MPKLTYTLDGQEHTVEVGDSCSIGRAPTNDIALESEAGASRRHVQINLVNRFYVTEMARDAAESDSRSHGNSRG